MGAQPFKFDISKWKLYSQTIMKPGVKPSCPATCYGHTSDQLHSKTDDTCKTLESQFGCDCSQCKCLGDKPQRTEKCPPQKKNAPTCVKSWQGDKNCDDRNNVCRCGWDGGDCCGADKGHKYCTDCACKDPRINCDGSCAVYSFR